MSTGPPWQKEELSVLAVSCFMVVVTGCKDSKKKSHYQRFEQKIRDKDLLLCSLADSRINSFDKNLNKLF
jgi:hypothetical protein